MTSIAYGIAFPTLRGVLTPPQIKSGGLSPLLDGLVAYWKFDEASGTTTADATGNGNTGTLVNGPTWAAGKINGGINFTSNQYVNIGNNPALNFNGAMPFTLAGWGKTSTAINAIMFDGLTGSSGYRLGLGVGGGTPAGAMSLFIGGGWKHSNATNLADGAWHHLAVTYDGTSLAFYIDGAFDSSTTTAGPTTISMNRSFANVAGTSFPFGGLIDEFGAWNRALSASDIASLYNGGAGLRYPF